MGKGRFEAFSDGVIAIIITIMVLELKVPHGEGIAALRPLLPVFLSYALSFVNIGIYWNNHHHLLHTVTRVTASMLWANLHLLFWLSLLPFATGWLGENHFAGAPVALYGVVLLMSGFAYSLLQLAIMRAHGPDSILRKAVGRDPKAMVAIAAYVVAVSVSFVAPRLSLACYVFVAAIYVIPDTRIARVLGSE